MLKHDIKNYFRQFTKALSNCFQWNTTHTNLLICNYFLTWTVKCLCQIWNSFRWIYSFYWKKYVRYIKLFKNQGTGCCYNINATFTGSPKDGLLELPNSNSGTFTVFPAFEKEIVKVSVKISWRFDIILFIWSICLFLITYDK